MIFPWAKNDTGVDLLGGNWCRIFAALTLREMTVRTHIARCQHSFLVSLFSSRYFSHYNSAVLRVIELSKRFGALNALHGVSIEVTPQMVLGFLGPNGAGKTTALRIMAGLIPPTTGHVEICGVPMERDPISARRLIGYLPESVPLYGEMRVEEYLSHRAALKEVPRRERGQRVEEVLHELALREVRRRIIGQLSKGTRQRVGLADALMHHPKVLLLDEPTDGLDPNQRRDALTLIGRLGAERAVVLSTHLLPEVETVCTQVVILDGGRIIARGAPTELANNERWIFVVARGERSRIERALLAISGVERIVSLRQESTGVLAISLECGHDVREELARAVTRVGELRELRSISVGLGDVFSRLTGKST
jgi:ABC-2 type transport system ATP-binding protein